MTNREVNHRLESKIAQLTCMCGLHSDSWSSGKIPRCGGFTVCFALLKFLLDIGQVEASSLLRRSCSASQEHHLTL